MDYNILMISLPTNYPLSEITIKSLTNEKIKKLHHYKKTNNNFKKYKE